MSALNATLSRAWTQPDSNTSSRIDLTDNTQSKASIPSIEVDQDPSDEGPLAPVSTQISNNRISRITTLKEDIARRRYSKFSEAKYREAGLAGRAVGYARKASTVKWDLNDTQQRSTGDNDEGGESAVVVDQAGKLRSGSRKVKGAVNLKNKTENRSGPEIAVDILYENQRGWFFFGLPLYSSASLLNFDASPWTTAAGEPSAVDTSNAQLPDPSWEWDWKTWYVDMSLDVDEQGWEYSFMFQRPFAWHGTHPWPYSFVRRRRWIRTRVKKYQDVPNSDREGQRNAKHAHKLTSDYFTIHSTMSKSPAPSYAGSLAKSSATSVNNLTTTEDTEIETIPALIGRLKIATVDREKINAVVQYMDQAGEDSYYLADEMEHITSLFLFQHSRRHLLTSMTKKLDSLEKSDVLNTSATAPETSGHLKPDTVKRPSENALAPSISKASTQVDGPRERLQRKIANLRRAAEAADKQVKQLEYWSDIKEIVQQGETAGGADEGGGWDRGWQGIDASGPATEKDKGKARAVD